jgi:hypothetical protein
MTGGHTRHTAVRGLVNLAVLLAGYAAAPIAGFVDATLVSAGRSITVLWATIALLTVTLLARVLNLFGMVLLVLLGAILWITATSASGEVQTFVALTWAWLLLIVGVVGFARRHRVRRSERRSGGRDTSSDAYQLWRRTWLIPPIVWVATFFALSLAALVGALILFGYTIVITV